ncbi:zinc-binding alcohol dehydrogenase family protein [Methylotenera versatilis]|uniref:zinc-binding alcohol dehydrogenase family protein n=1 Tax=Methylotenera versatilis TaxID=1055487 RepID=UPI00064710A6|nr:zinc-binding alcohol dehydrogenase family protein [Methylotenera versatilis]
MKAIALTRYLPIENPDSLVDIELAIPEPLSHDLLVKICAIAVNPVDTKVRKPKDKVETTPKVLGWDAAGEVIAVGDAVTLFKVGDLVYYAGDVTRSGCNAEYQLMDERIVGHKPQSLNFEAAAALPLTAVTAWEALFDRLGIAQDANKNKDKSILIIGAAGGVGSIAIQLAKKVAGLNVIATASRPETTAWVRDLGADIVLNHHQLLQEISQLNIQPDYILCNNDTDGYFEVMAAIIKPQGKICSIVETAKPVNLDLLKSKSATFVWEFMFTRSMFKTDDMIAQHQILQHVAQLIDAGTLTTTLNQVLRPINAENLRKAHAQLESGTTIGKLVLSGW